MHLSIPMKYSYKPEWVRAAAFGLAVAVSLSVPALCLAQSTVPSFTISTVVGQGPPSSPSYGGDGYAAISAYLNGPASVAFDSKGNMYICDQVNDVIRMVTASTGNISTVAGNNSAGYSGDGKAAISAQLNGPDSIVVDSKGNFYFSDFNNGVIRMVNPSGVISTFAGSQAAGKGFSGDGGAATASALFDPTGIAFDPAGNLIISDYGTYADLNYIGNDRIREVYAATGIINTIVGTGTVGYDNGGGVALAAHLNGVAQVAVDNNGNLYFADSFNNQIRKVVLATGTISLLAGSSTTAFGYSGDGGLATDALLNDPTGVAVDAAGNVYICDTFNDVIRVVTPDGLIHTVAGLSANAPNPGFSGDGGPALSAQFNSPYSITIDSSGNLYVADYGNSVIRKLAPSSSSGTGAPAPAIRTASGVISASDFGALSAVAPGSWIEIYGSNLAATTRQWGANDFTGINGINAPTGLNNTTVSIGGQAAFVEYISAAQVNVQVPGTVGLGSQPVIVSTSAGSSKAYNVNVNLEEPALYAPAVFSTDFTGLVGNGSGSLKQAQQQVAWAGALFPDLTTYAFPTASFAGIGSRAAKPGDTIVFYGIGFAQVPLSPPGTVPQVANGLSLPVAPNFYFNGVQAQVTYAGLAPQTATTGYLGLYQFNVIVPAISVPVGQIAAVPVTVSVNENGTVVFGTQTLYTAISN
ncbi:MAG TPA: hypothetical protein VHW09_20815 [Bryobacteraceae bacterium]|jgi:uncharacterized protein (TIGR03437 family)|nr:hypothetical protein [Bryobacteraceae bacterium]